MPGSCLSVLAGLGRAGVTGLVGRPEWSGAVRSGGLGAGSSAVGLCGGGLDLSDANEVKAGGGRLQPRLVASSAEIAQLAAADRLDLAEDLFDPCAPAPTLAVSVMPRRPTIDRAAPPAIILGHVRGDAERPRVLEEVARVVAAVGAQRGRTRDTALQHLQRRLAFGIAVGLVLFDIDD